MVRHPKLMLKNLRNQAAAEIETPMIHYFQHDPEFVMLEALEIQMVV